MKTNVGHKERIARVLAGLTILKSAKSKKMKALGLMPLVSGATGHCPAYQMMGINTAACQSKQAVKNDKNSQAEPKADSQDSKTSTEKMDEATPA